MLGVLQKLRARATYSNQVNHSFCFLKISHMNMTIPNAEIRLPINRIALKKPENRTSKKFGSFEYAILKIASVINGLKKIIRIPIMNRIMDR